MSVDSNILHMYHIHTQLFNGPLSRTTRVPTHNHDVEKGFTVNKGPLYMAARPLYSALSQRGLSDPIKPAYNQSRYRLDHAIR